MTDNIDIWITLSLLLIDEDKTDEAVTLLSPPKSSGAVFTKMFDTRLTKISNPTCPTLISGRRRAPPLVAATTSLAVVEAQFKPPSQPKASRRRSSSTVAVATSLLVAAAGHPSQILWSALYRSSSPSSPSSNQHVRVINCCINLSFCGCTPEDFHFNCCCPRLPSFAAAVYHHG
ncbi:hypothetical protein PR202_gb25451 [Eleusine coracana subsp. coracana]|uniref:Uncharacterized protein n=1 Tax=Eleusine coracana subsp. coracana TaxID=191504 RepID=A0AAV5FP93_ELECO|nr:hypothetical protein PR202_gb25451 [Eleusine coracana subsp. coracana]